MLRLILGLIPARWRPTVTADLSDERTHQGRSLVWLGVQALRIGLTFRRAEVQRLTRDGWAILRHGWRTDVRLAVRSAQRQPGSSLAIVLMLGLGIGATSSTYAVFDHLIFRPVPGVEDEGRLVSLYIRRADNPLGMTSTPFTRFRAMRAHAPALVGIAALSQDTYRLAFTADGPPTSVRGDEVTRDFFQLLGVRPRVGRVPTGDEYETPGSRLVVISERLWASAFDRDPQIVGRALWINEQRFSIIGVAASYGGNSLVSEPDELWIPYGARSLTEPPGRVDDSVFKMVGRLAPGATVEVAQAQLRAAFVALGPVVAGGHTYLPLVFPGLADGIGTVRTELLAIYDVLLAGVAMLLVLACANAANLIVARNVGRARDLSLRGAIGASRARLMREMLVEAAGLALTAGGLGLLFDLACLGAFRGLQLLPGLPRFGVVALDWRVVGVTFASAIATLLLFGVLPAWSAARVDIRDRLAQAGMTTRRGGTVRTGLVVVQIAIAFTLVVGTALLEQTVIHLEGLDLGFNVRGLQVVTLRPGGTFDRSTEILQTIRQHLADSQVGTVGLMQFEPLSNVSIYSVRRRDRPGSEPTTVGGCAVDGDAMAALDVPLRAGRRLSSADDHGDIFTTGGPVVVGERVARTLFGTPAAALGQHLLLSLPKATPDLEIVGVAADLTHYALRDGPQPTAFFPLAKGGLRSGALLVRTSLPAAEVTARLREIAHDVDVTLPVEPMRPVTETRDDVLSRERVLARLGLLVAGLAAFLALAGVYAVVAFVVSERTREFGIRLALGASTQTVARSVLSSVLGTAGAGLLIGLLLIVWTGHVLSKWLYGVRPFDPATIVTIVPALLACALVAGAWPARRAARINPTVALRTD